MHSLSLVYRGELLPRPHEESQSREEARAESNREGTRDARDRSVVVCGYMRLVRVLTPVAV